MKGFSKTIFLLSLGVFLLLLIPALIAAAAQDEGTLGNGRFEKFISTLFLILRFPTHTFLWPLIGVGGFITYFAGLFINCMLYALIVERICHVFGYGGKKV